MDKESLCRYYQDCIFQEQGKIALDYLKSRGITEEVIRDFRIGYCPEGFNGIWARRVMFPLIDAYGRVVAFSGRIITYNAVDSNGDKLVVEQNTNRIIKRITQDGKKNEYAKMQFHDSFKKKFFLYGLHQAKKHIIDSGYVIVVEGQSDVMSMHSNGYKNVVGTCGTALTMFHIINLYRYTDKFIFMFDADKAGLSALKLAKERSIVEYFSINLPEGDDPNSYILKNGIFGISETINKILDDSKKTFSEKVIEKISTGIFS